MPYYEISLSKGDLEPRRTRVSGWEGGAGGLQKDVVSSDAPAEHSADAHPALPPKFKGRYHTLQLVLNGHHSRRPAAAEIWERCQQQSREALVHARQQLDKADSQH